MDAFIIMEVFVFAGAALGWGFWELYKTDKSIKEDKAKEREEE